MYQEFDDVYTIRLFPQIHGDNPDQTNGLIETYGDHFDFISNFIQQHPGNIKHVWTVVEGDDNNLYVTAGFHIVNRLNFIISNEQWKSEEEVYVWCDFSEFHEDDEEEE